MVNVRERGVPPWGPADMISERGHSLALRLRWRYSGDIREISDGDIREIFGSHSWDLRLRWTEAAAIRGMAERFRDALAALGDAEEAAEVMHARSALSCMRRSPAEKVPT